VPTISEDIEQVKPVYETFPGWQADTTKAKTWKDLPPKARHYLQAIAKMIDAKILIASIGPARNQTIFV
jgi:adenylosuccinate synthase